MPIYYGASQITAVKKAAADLSSLLVPSLANPGQLVESLLAPPSQVTGLAVDSTGDGTLDLSWTAPASDATITDYSVAYTDVQPLTGVALLAPYDSDLDDILGISATATNTPTVTSGGKFGSYADLGAADKLAYSSVPFGSGDYTVEFWVQRTESSWAPNGGNPLLTLPGVAMLGREGADTLGLYEDDFGSWASVAGTTTASIDQLWHHIALVRDGSTLRFYLDGSQVGTTSTSTSPSSIELGASSIYGCRFGVDDLRVSTSAVYPSGTTFTPPTVAHPTGGGGTTATVLVGSAATNYQLTSLTNDTEYSVRVAAVSAAGTGPYSASVTGTPTPSVATGSLYTWGDNSGGQLGTGSTTDVNYLTPQSDTSSWIKAVTGTDQYSHSLAIRADGSLYAAGYGFYGALGLGTNVDSTTFAASASGSWSDVAVGNSHSLAIKSDGSLWGTGYNANGQLGIGSTTDTNSFTQVGSATDWASVEGGHHQSYAITTAGELYAWGYGGYGSLGLGSTSDQTTPAKVGTAAWLLISAFQFHTLGLRTDGTLWAWGTNGGRFGDGGTNNSNTPIQIGTDTWLSVAAGRAHSLGVKSDGTLWGWGYSGNYAHGGSGTLTSPTQIGSATNWTKVSAGDDWSAAIDNAKGLYLWGSSSNSKTGGASSPTQAGSLLWESVYCGRQSGIGIANT